MINSPMVHNALILLRRMLQYGALLLFFILNASNTKPPQTLQKTFEGKFIKVNYSMENGRMHGAYQSFYSNGQLKAQGRLEHNYRIGNWTVWDSTGSKRMERHYTSPFRYQRLYPKVSSSGPIPLLSTPIYSPKRNADGLYDYFPLKERMVVYVKRIWRTVKPFNNPILFESQLLFDALAKEIDAGRLKTYSGEDDQFREEIDLISSNLAHLPITHFKIKEEWVFDNERLLMECRIIGICPVVEYSNSPTDLCWIYYPEARKAFAKTALPPARRSNSVKSLDDLFFFRHFSGTIYKESNYQDIAIQEYTKGKAKSKEAERIEINLIEAEHNLWINLSKAEKP